MGDDDLAAVAAAAPEPASASSGGRVVIGADAMGSVTAGHDGGEDSLVHAVGVGPGPARYRTDGVRRLLAEADVVVGFETVLEYVADDAGGDLLACRYDDQEATLATFADRIADGEHGVAAFMGDPNVSGYQFLGRVERAVAGRVRVVPGVSSIQLAAGKARVPLEATTFASLHQRGDVSADLDRLARDVGDRHLLVLPRPYDLMPGDVAARLLEAGASGALTALVYERLAHEDEARTATTLAGLADRIGGTAPADAAFSDLSVLVVRRRQ